MVRRVRVGETKREYNASLPGPCTMRNERSDVKALTLRLNWGSLETASSQSTSRCSKVSVLRNRERAERCSGAPGASQSTCNLKDWREANFEMGNTRVGEWKPEHDSETWASRGIGNVRVRGIQSAKAGSSRPLGERDPC